MDILDSAKDMYSLIKKLGNQDLLEKMADLRDEIFSLREENRELKEKLSFRDDYNMVFEGTCYWNVKDGETKDGPFCPTCWDKDRKAIRMHSGRIGTLYKGAPDNIYLCHVCKSTIRKFAKD